MGYGCLGDKRLGRVINLGWTEGLTLHRISYEEYVARYNRRGVATYGLLARIAANSNVELPPVSAVSEAAAIPAFFHRDHLIVGCEDCGDYQLVWQDMPLFMCSVCWNANAGGQFIRVTVPDNIHEIYDRLRVRKFPEHRNWLPGETLATLDAENDTHPDWTE